MAEKMVIKVYIILFPLKYKIYQTKSIQNFAAHSYMRLHNTLDRYLI